MNESSIFKDIEEQTPPVSDACGENLINLSISLGSSISAVRFAQELDVHAAHSDQSLPTNLLAALSLSEREGPSAFTGGKAKNGSSEYLGMGTDAPGTLVTRVSTNTAPRDAFRYNTFTYPKLCITNRMHSVSPVVAPAYGKNGKLTSVPANRGDSEINSCQRSILCPEKGNYSSLQNAFKCESASSGSTPHSTENTWELKPTERFVDEFGFLLDEDAREMDRLYRETMEKDKRLGCEDQWARMTTDWVHTYNKRRDKLKRRCRKGIPAKLRGTSWQLLIGSHSIMKSSANTAVYIVLRNKTLKDEEVDMLIERDLARTFPNNVMYQEEGGVGQVFLRNVLHAYAACDPEVGYTQGMAFLVAALATQMGEEESFWAFHEMMYHERYKMRELFRPGFPMLKQFFYQLKRLLSRLLPNLYEKLERLGVDPSFYASEWFLTLFVYHFPFHALLRIWDIFFSEGWKIIFRTGIALMKWEEKRLLKMPFEQLLPALKSLQDGKNCDELLHRAHRIKFKTKELKKYADDYLKSLAVDQTA